MVEGIDGRVYHKRAHRQGRRGQRAPRGRFARGRPSVTHARAVSHGNGRTLLRSSRNRPHASDSRAYGAHRPSRVGDFLYGREDATLPGRFALHSAYLALDWEGTRMVWESPLPAELKALLEG